MFVERSLQVLFPWDSPTGRGLWGAVDPTAKKAVEMQAGAKERWREKAVLLILKQCILCVMDREDLVTSRP
ncbi:hypothetical protein I79_004197 [Cricetulus griseus]|uniref:Uncharacterized protein n=1 Tax=Cricetulus griseus TaxID=10029 RepID=G3H1Z8_CRIGR|nr:hypothetical protein I79_004197 [Cricetulus griseus]